MQFVADVLRAELRVARDLDSAARGAASMGASGLKLTASEGFTASRAEVSYRPRMPEEQVQQRYAGWQRAVKQVLYSP
jgi:glycerol kinase